MRRPLIIMDVAPIDGLSVQHGLFRQARDLIQGLGALGEDRIEICVAGSLPKPVAALEAVIPKTSLWRYAQYRHASGRAAYLKDQLGMTLFALRQRPRLWHVMHETVPAVTFCPVIKTEYDLMYELFPEYAGAVRSRPYKLKRWLTQRRVTRVMPISESTGHDLQSRWGIEPGRITVVHLGSPFAGVAAAAESEIPEPVRLALQGPTIVSPFNLEPRKNLSSLLEAFAKARRTIPSLRLVLFGKGAWSQDRQNEFDATCSRLGIVNEVLLAGFVQDSVLAALYDRCTLMVFPSIYEGFGLPVLEAMSRGACVVAMSRSSMPEIVGAAGVTLDMRNPILLAETIVGLIQNEGRRNELGRAARERAKQFTVEAMARGVMSVYLETLGIH